MPSPISVIVPTFNRRDFVEECLESILAQTLPALEVIVVDDASTDETSRLLRRYGEPVHYLRHEENRGVSAARNTGIAHARGSHIAFCDSDDLWAKRKLEKQWQLFQQIPEAMVCHTDEIWIRRGKRVNPKKHHYKSGGWLFRRCLELCVVSPSSVMMERRFFDVVGTFDESLPACEDYDLWLRASLVYPFHFLPEKLIVKRGGHDDQLSHRYWGMDRFRVAAMVKCLEHCSLTTEQRHQAQAMLQKKCGILAAGAQKRGKIEEAEEYRALAQRYAG